jgi:transcriptional regulator with XRE-family HTH domain
MAKKLAGRLGKRIRELRREKAMSRKALAQESGVSNGRLRDYEKGKRKPSFKKGVRLTSALGVPCDALAGVVVKKSKTAEQIANSDGSGIQG